jgi:hemerythrin superfamily protein
MDPVALLVSEHRRMETQLGRLLDADEKDRPALLVEVADALAAHVAVEEEVFYPAVRQRRTEDILLESLEEHLSLKRVMSDLLTLDPDDATWAAKLHVLKEQVEHHHEEEESHLFPKVNKCFQSEQLEALGRHMDDRLRALRAERPRERVFGDVTEAAPLGSSDVSPLSARC